MTQGQSQGQTQGPGPKKTAGAFDIRNVIGALLVVYGVVLLIVYAVGANDAMGDNTDNLAGGLTFLVVGLVFLAWAQLRPIVVEPPKEGEAPKGGLH